MRLRERDISALRVLRVFAGSPAAALAQEIRAGVYDVEMNESTTVHIGVPET